MSKHIHAEICKELNDLYIRKNNDYGDSFAKLRNELPNAILVRIYDKYSRLKTLMEGTEQKVHDESIEDSLLDLANYAIMQIVEMRKDIDEQAPTKVYRPGELVPISQDWRTAREQREEIAKHIVYDEIEYVDADGKTKKLGLG